MTTSETIDQIATALSKAQGEMTGALKDSANPFFKSKYADLAAVWEACRKPLSGNGLAIIQSPTVSELRVSLDTLVVHTSGQWIRNTLSCAVKDDSPQTIGSATTYLRRYALQSLVGVAAEDDDGETAQGRGNGTGAHGRVAHQTSAPTAPAAVPDGYSNWLADMQAVADEGVDRLREEWKTQPEGFRRHLTQHDIATYEALRERAKKATVAA